MARLRRGERTTVVVFGGSMTQGNSCSFVDVNGNKTGGRGCAWPGRLHKWLAARYPAAAPTLQVVNGGVGMASIKTLEPPGAVAARLASLGLQREPDLVFLDFGINDDTAKRSGHFLSLAASVINVVKQLDYCNTAVVLCQSGTELEEYADAAAALRIAHVSFQAATRPPSHAAYDLGNWRPPDL